ncbi:hypothetical protein [Actinokineospora inagensis]|uniref:hypothetical protein n=1 Tax=Actinokineospora inagensis TaxID=103730 RepID=UPI0004122908|nr:hypothetical protein [Actinokineospora inagensis]
MSDGKRGTLATIVAQDSALGQAASAVDQLSAHLPVAGRPAACPLCRAYPWPCPRFVDAAARIHAAGIGLHELIPVDLHPALWPEPDHR